MPPPPPPAPPPPPPLIPNNQSSKQLPPAPVAAGDRNALLSQIRKGAQLKKATTNDRSAPIVNGKSSAPSAKPCNDGVPSSAVGKKPCSAGPVGLGDLFAQGVPKLKPTNKAFLDGGAYKSQLSPRGSLPKGGQASFNNAREAVNAQFASRNLSQSVDIKSKKQPMEREVSTNNKCMENSISSIVNHTLTVAEQPKNDSGINRGPLPPPPPSSNKKPTFNTIPCRKPNVVNSYLHKTDVPSEDSTPVINSSVEQPCLSSKPLLPDERARSFNKPLLPEERTWSSSKPLPPDERTPSSSKPLPPDERTRSSSKPLLPEERTRSSSKPLLPEEQTRSSSKPLPPDERTRSSSKPLLPDEGTRSSSKPLPLPKVGAIGNTSPLPMKPPSANTKPKPKSYDDTDIPNNFRQRDGRNKSNEFPQGLKSVQNNSIPSNLNKLQNGPTQPRPPPPRQNKRNPVKPTMAPPPLPPWALCQQGGGGGSLNDIRQGNAREPPPPPPGGYLSATLPRPPPPPPRSSSQSATMDRKHAAPKAPYPQCGKSESLTQSMVIGGSSFENRFASKYRNPSELPKPDAFSNKSKTYPSKLARAKNGSKKKSRKARQPPPPAPPPPPPPLQFA